MDVKVGDWAYVKRGTVITMNYYGKKQLNDNEIKVKIIDISNDMLTLQTIDKRIYRLFKSEIRLAPKKDLDYLKFLQSYFTRNNIRYE